MDFFIFISIIFAAIIIAVSLPGNWNYGLELNQIKWQLARIANNLERIAGALEDKEEDRNAR